MQGLERLVDVAGGGLSFAFGAIFCGVGVALFSVGLAMIWAALFYGK